MCWASLIFLKEISSISYSIVFPLFLCIVHLRRLSYLSLLFSVTLHSVGYFFPFPFPLLLFSTICNAFLHFFFFGMALVTAYCTMLGSSVHSFYHINQHYCRQKCSRVTHKLFQTCFLLLNLNANIFHQYIFKRHLIIYSEN